jgi:chromosome partitioning protein
VLIPLQCEYFALEGISELVNTMRRVQRALNPKLEIEGVLLTMVDERTNLTQQVMGEIREHFKDKVFRTTIPRSVRLGEAPSFGKPILLYDIKSRGSEAYLDLAKEVMAHEKKGSRQGALRTTAGS